MRLEIQKWFDNGGTIEGLLGPYGIKARRHREFPNLVLFKYDQIASPFAEPIVRECRGIVLDESNGWAVVSRAFDKFFNHGEGHAAPIDWTTAVVQEKLDGSMCAVYSYGGKVHVATTGTPDGSGDVNGAGITFADLFWRTAGAYGVGPVDFESWPGITIVLELCAPENRIIVEHRAPTLHVIAARHAASGEFCPMHELGLFLRIPPAKTFPLGSFDDMIGTFSSLSPLSTEGYVVTDAAHNKVKVKHPGYVALHHAKDGLTDKAFLQIARSGETSEVIAAFPEFAARLDEIRARLEDLVVLLERQYAEIRDIPVQKDFAIALNGMGCPLTGALFGVRAKKDESIRAHLARMPIDKLAEVVLAG